MSNSNRFNSKQFQLNSISTRFNWIEFQFKSIESNIKFNINSDQFMSISRRFHFNKPIQFQINSIHFGSISISIHNIPIQLQLNEFSTQFNSISFQFNSTSWKLIIWGLEGSPPTASRKLKFLKRICNQKTLIFRRAPDLDFDCFLVEIGES